VDYCILNEIEAGKTTGFRIRQTDGRLDTSACVTPPARSCSRACANWSSFTFPERRLRPHAQRRRRLAPSLKLPDKQIVGGRRRG